MGKTLWDMTDEEKEREPLRTLISMAKSLEKRRLDDGMSFAAEQALEMDGDKYIKELDRAYDAGVIDETVFLDLCSIAFYDYCGAVPSYLG